MDELDNIVKNLEKEKEGIFRSYEKYLQTSIIGRVERHLTNKLDSIYQVSDMKSNCVSWLENLEKMQCRLEGIEKQLESLARIKSQEAEN